VGWSGYGPTLPTWALQQVVGYLRYTGRDANVVTQAARDPYATSELRDGGASTFPPRARPPPVTSSCIPQIFGVIGETAEMLQPSDGADLGLSDYIGGEPASFRFRLNLSTA